MCIRDRLGTLATLVSAEVACITYRLETCTAWPFSGVIRTPMDVGTTSDQVASSRSFIDTSLVRACFRRAHADSWHPAATSLEDGTVSGTCPRPAPPVERPRGRVVSVAPTDGEVTMTVRDDLRAQVEAMRPAVEAVARAIHSDPETADEEHRAVARHRLHG